MHASSQFYGALLGLVFAVSMVMAGYDAFEAMRIKKEIDLIEQFQEKVILIGKNFLDAGGCGHDRDNYRVHDAMLSAYNLPLDHVLNQFLEAIARMPKDVTEKPLSQFIASQYLEAMGDASRRKEDLYKVVDLYQCTAQAKMMKNLDQFNGFIRDRYVAILEEDIRNIKSGGIVKMHDPPRLSAKRIQELMLDG